MNANWTHRHRRNKLEVRLISDKSGIVVYEVPWSYLERRRDSSSFHALYEPIEEET